MHEERLPQGISTQILEALLRHPEGLTRQGLANELGLPPSTVSSLLRGEHRRELEGVVVETKAERAAPGGGPRPKILRLRDGICIAGVEIGHGHVRVGIAGLDGRLLAVDDDEKGFHYAHCARPVFRERLNTLNWIAGEPGGELGALPQRLSSVFGGLKLRSDTAMEKPLVLAVGVSVAGSVDPDDGRLLCARSLPPTSPEEANIACGDWDGESAGTGLRDRLRRGDEADVLGWTASRFRSIGAANLCAQAELHDGVLQGVNNAIFVKWTGEVTAAVVIDGSVYTGSRGLAGGLPPRRLGKGEGKADAHDPEFGRPEEPGEPLSVAIGIRRIATNLREDCGLRAQAENELLRDYFRSEILRIAHGEAGTKRQTEKVKEHLRKAARRLGAALAPSVDMLNPSRVVLGGGAFEPRDWPIVAEHLLEGIRENIVAPGETPRVELAAHTDHPALHGAVISRLSVAKLVPQLQHAAQALAH